MRCVSTLMLVASVALAAYADEPKLTPMPDTFPTLVNPSCEARFPTGR